MQKPDLVRPANALVTAWKIAVVIAEAATAMLIAGAFIVAACAPLEPDPRGGIHTECAPDGGPSPQTSCAQGQYAYCFERGDGGTLLAICCNAGVSFADCERSAQRDR